MEVSTSIYDFDRNHPAVMQDTKERPFWYLTFNEILTIICAASIPIALGIYTGVTSGQQQQQAEQRRLFDFNQAEELRQQTLYDKFLNDMYMLHKDGHLEEEVNPWVFANAYHRVAHRQWDAQRKADALQFLVERGLIGSNKLSRTRATKQTNDTIRLNELNFDDVYLTSQTNSLNLLDLRHVSFDQVSMVKTRFKFVNLDETSFNWARLNDARFDDSSLVYATFDSTELHRTYFGHSNLNGTRFLNTNMTTSILTPYQIQQAIFINTTLPNGTFVQPTTIMPDSTFTQTTTIITTPSTQPTTTKMTGEIFKLNSFIQYKDIYL